MSVSARLAQGTGRGRRAIPVTSARGTRTPTPPPPLARSVGPIPERPGHSLALLLRGRLKRWALAGEKGFVPSLAQPGPVPLGVTCWARSCRRNFCRSRISCKRIFIAIPPKPAPPHRRRLFQTSLPLPFPGLKRLPVCAGHMIPARCHSGYFYRGQKRPLRMRGGGRSPS